MTETKATEDRKWTIDEMMAVAIAATAVRSELEDLHAGDFPRTVTGDWSDVKVVHPGGEIPWLDLCRISNDEMRDLMISVADSIFAAMTRTRDEPMLALSYVHLAVGSRKFQRPGIPRTFEDIYGLGGLDRPDEKSERAMVKRVANDPDLLREMMFRLFSRGRTDVGV